MKKYYFNCPRCQSDDSFYQVSEEPARTGCALLIFGGLWPALIYWTFNAKRIQCSNCSHIFRQPPLPQTSISNLSVWILFVMVISISIMLLFQFIPELNSVVRKFYFFNILDYFIKTSPMGVALGMVVMTSGILLLITFASGISNYRFRKYFKEQYKVYPEPNVISKVGNIHSADAKSRAAD